MSKIGSLSGHGCTNLARKRVVGSVDDEGTVIHPLSDFRVVNALLTNFHLPKSSLIMLVSAMAGRDLIMRAYAEAIAQRYRFYSYGACMLIV